jgi:ELMO domain-containing protein
MYHILQSLNLKLILSDLFHIPGMPSSQAGSHFLDLLPVDENAFDKLYCVAFRLMDAQWLVKRASYMEFNVPCTF